MPGAKKVSSLMARSLILSFGLFVVAFQNCSETLPGGQTVSSQKGQLAFAAPTPAPLTGVYSANPAVVGAPITLAAFGGTGVYSYFKVSGNGALNGAVYQAPASPEIALFRIADSSGASIQLQVQVLLPGQQPTPTPTPSPTPSPNPPQYGSYSTCGDEPGIGDRLNSCLVANPKTGACTCPPGSMAVLASTGAECTALELLESVRKNYICQAP